jgi:hydroxymethylglutaryl-CoA lyase
MSLYPKTAAAFINFIQSDKKLLNKYIIKNISNVRPFDVTLRDGLQSLTHLEQRYFTTEIKKALYQSIIENYNPKNIEIGSCVNKKLLPMFNDTEDLLIFSENFNRRNNLFNNYVLVPNLEQLINAINIGFKNFSFITSVSDSFQIKNTKMSLNENYENINNMLAFLDDSRLKDYKIKLYVSCIDKCPIEGKIKINTIIDNLVKLYKLKPDKLCLSDTCGDLKLSQFDNILKGLILNNIDISKLSLHLHVRPERENDVEQLVHSALDYGINEFDVSAINSGGCSIAIDRSKLAPNMMYEQYYRFLSTYLKKNI